MIRPYYAIIKDSFREALASRILVVVLFLITGVLLLAAPLTYVESKTVGFHRGDVEDWEVFAQQFRSEARRKNRVAQHLWGLMSAEQQQLFTDFKPLKANASGRERREQEQRESQLAKILDELLKREDFFNRSAWQDVNLSLEARTLRGDDKLETEGRERLSRVTLEDAFDGSVKRSPPTSMKFMYGPLAISDPTPIRKQQFARGIEQMIPWLVDKGLLSIGLFVALLVTAPAVPQMFEPGSLHLLLSKPVWRSMLFLAKFVGSCAFVLICAIYLFFGIWLWLGTRLGLWEHQLFWCIPLYSFVFMIYYSVAALAALWWRNTILSIVSAALFWGLCTAVGLSEAALHGAVEKQEIVRLTQARGSLIAVTGLHMPMEWNADTGNWRNVCVSDEQEQFSMLFSLLPNLPPPVGPVYDARNDQLVRIGLSFQTQRFAFVTGKRSEGWKYKEGASTLPPQLTITMLNEPDGSVLLVSHLGLFRLTGDLRSKAEQPKIFGMTLPFSAGGPMTELRTEPAISFQNPAAASIDNEGVFAVYSHGAVTTLERKNSRIYKQLAQAKLFEKDPPAAVIANGAGIVLLASADGTVRELDAATLAEQRRDQPAGRDVPRGAWVSPDGRWLVVVFHSGDMWLRDKQAGDWQLAPVKGQGEINTAFFTPQGTLLVGHQMTKVTEYELPSGKIVKRYSPPLTITELSYRYGILPVYTLCPKPGEFYKTVQYLMTREEITAATEKDEDLGAAHTKLNPWAPVWSSALFVGVMLLVSCVYIEWQEF